MLPITEANFARLVEQLSGDAAAFREEEQKEISQKLRKRLTSAVKVNLNVLDVPSHVKNIMETFKKCQEVGFFGHGKVCKCRSSQLSDSDSANEDTALVSAPVCVDNENFGQYMAHFPSCVDKRGKGLTIKINLPNSPRVFMGTNNYDGDNINLSISNYGPYDDDDEDDDNAVKKKKSRKRPNKSKRNKEPPKKLGRKSGIKNNHEEKEKSALTSYVEQFQLTECDMMSISPETPAGSLTEEMVTSTTNSLYIADVIQWQQQQQEQQEIIVAPCNVAATFEDVGNYIDNNNKQYNYVFEKVLEDQITTTTTSSSTLNQYHSQTLFNNTLPNSPISLPPPPLSTNNYDEDLDLSKKQTYTEPVQPSSFSIEQNCDDESDDVFITRLIEAINFDSGNNKDLNNITEDETAIVTSTTFEEAAFDLPLNNNVGIANQQPMLHDYYQQTGQDGQLYVMRNHFGGDIATNSPHTNQEQLEPNWPQQILDASHVDESHNANLQPIAIKENSDSIQHNFTSTSSPTYSDNRHIDWAKSEIDSNYVTPVNAVYTRVDQVKAEDNIGPSTNEPDEITAEAVHITNSETNKNTEVVKKETKNFDELNNFKNSSVLELDSKFEDFMPDFESDLEDDVLSLNASDDDLNYMEPKCIYIEKTPLEDYKKAQKRYDAQIISCVDVTPINNENINNNEGTTNNFKPISCVEIASETNNGMRGNDEGSTINFKPRLQSVNILRKYRIPKLQKSLNPTTTATATTALTLTPTPATTATITKLTHVEHNDCGVLNQIVASQQLQTSSGKPNIDNNKNHANVACCGVRADAGVGPSSSRATNSNKMVAPHQLQTNSVQLNIDNNKNHANVVCCNVRADAGVGPRSSRASNLNVVEFFGATCFAYLYDECPNNIDCQHKHELRDSFLIENELLTLSEREINVAYNFMYNHAVLFRTYFGAFGSFYTKRNKRIELLSMVNDCIRYADGYKYLHSIFYSLMQCGLSKENACRLILNRCYDTSPNTINSLVNIILETDWVMFAGYLKKFSQLPNFSYQSEMIHYMGTTILQKRDPELMMVFTSCLATKSLEDVRNMLNDSEDLLQVLNIIHAHHNTQQQQ